MEGGSASESAQSICTSNFLQLGLLLTYRRRARYLCCRNKILLTSLIQCQSFGSLKAAQVKTSNPVQPSRTGTSAYQQPFLYSIRTSLLQSHVMYFSSFSPRRRLISSCQSDHNDLCSIYIHIFIPLPPASSTFGRCSNPSRHLCSVHFRQLRLGS